MDPGYSLALRREFEAHHYLVGGDWGPENELHAHNYRLELELAGQNLDQHGFLVDLVEVEELVNDTIDQFRGQTLNERAEFEGLNPSLEHFCRILSEAFAERLTDVDTITVRLWEDDVGWASYRSVLK